MNHSAKQNKGYAITVTGLIVMILLTLTKVVPSSSIAGYSVLIGIALFFIVEAVTKSRDAESGLRFGTVLEDIKKPGVLIWMLLPVVSAIAAFIVGNLIFNGEYVSHVMGRAGAVLSFDKLPLLIGQVVIAAWGEEIAYRGFFVGKGMKIAPFWPCAVVSSVVFAAGHIAPGNVGLVVYDVALVFIDSMIYSIVYRKTDNCLVSTISHVLSNAVAIVAACTIFSLV